MQAGRGANPVFWINMGSGVGGGLVWTAAFITARCRARPRSDTSASTSRAYVWRRCSGWAVDRRIRAGVNLHPGGVLASWRGIAKAAGQRAGTGFGTRDELAHAILSELADNLAFALSHAVQLFRPGSHRHPGRTLPVGEPLRQAVAEALVPYVGFHFPPGPKLVLAGLGEDSVPVGALALAAGASTASTAATAEYRQTLEGAPAVGPSNQGVHPHRPDRPCIDVPSNS